MPDNQIPVIPDIAATTNAGEVTVIETRAWGAWFKWLALALVLFLVAKYTIHGIQGARSNIARGNFKTQLGRVALGLHQYEEQYGAFPPAYTVGSDGQPLHSWRVLLLPTLGEQDLYAKLRLNEPWNSPHNSQFHQQRPDVFSHPWFGDSLPGEAHVVAIVGPETAWPEHYSAKVRDVIDGTWGSLHLVGYSEAEIHWMEPRDVTSAQVLETIVTPINPAAEAWHGVLVAFVDGNVRLLSKSIDRKILRSLISINGGIRLTGVNWPPPPLEDPRAFSPVRSASYFRGTEVSPVLDTALTGGKNLIWCATFQIVWDQGHEQTRGTLQSDTQSDLINKLNQSRFDLRNLSADSYVVGAGTARDVPQFLEQLRSRKIGGQLSPRLLETQGNGFFLYAALSKQLPFAVKFDRFEDQLTFKSSQKSDPVASFGILSNTADDRRIGQFERQVKVLNHVSDEDFIVRLDTRLGKDEIYLAKIPPGQTLATTLQAAQTQIAKPVTNGFRSTIGRGDRLLIPVLELSIAKDFDLSNQFIQASQTIQFRLDETGAILESEALLMVADFEPSEYDPEKPRKLIFDRPFLIWMQERNASAPYLVAWVANSEWMVPCGPKPSVRKQ